MENNTLMDNYGNEIKQQSELCGDVSLCFHFIHFVFLSRTWKSLKFKLSITRHKKDLSFL